jgi:hypothetical protein
VEPVMRYEEYLKPKENKNRLNRNDQYKIPVKMQSEVNMLGSISAKLKKFRYGEINKKE